MSEYFDVLNEKGEYTGKVESREICHKEGLWHKAVAVFVVNSKGQVLLQKRSAKKKMWPNMWDITAGGHVDSGEFGFESIIREIKEELGVDIEVIEKLYELDNKEIGQMEYFFLCKYISGKLGTGDGPEFSGDPKYSNRGNYIPKIVERENIENINLLPSQIKAKLVEDIKKGRF